MKKNYVQLLCLITITILLSSCYSKKKITYLYDLRDSIYYSSTITNASKPLIQDDDILLIKVATLDNTTNMLFNTGTLPIGQSSTSGASNTLAQEGYLVDKNGQIMLPYIGKITVAGKTKEEVKEIITKEIGKYVKDPIVNISFNNFKYSVLGEVGSPGVKTVKGERINVFEAIAEAGDMSMFAERNKVMLLRETNGKREMVRLDFQDSRILESPYFYLKQNDILYVEPTKYRDETSSRRMLVLTATSSMLGLGTSILTLIKLYQ